ncbi:unnamed protein product [Acanthoscelides obtectus]|uniref:Uncharacterized protein n=1 Tax=Acanthoscelides obtectus TaxID=200917 RepID=A0A9P0LN69_ACAOB|nr:unnamed protein product [Acanthoscelides obtectus]CAK1642424.1 hypothetical protein AOBTE_LOCUS13022 [Acanthoscelides obtectus]
MKYLIIATIFYCLFANAYTLYQNEISLKCNGKRFENVTLTAYYPDYNEEQKAAGYLDKKGKLLNTLQDYIDNRADYVTLSMDESLGIPYGTKVCIPELNDHFGHRIVLEVRDSSFDLSGSGYSRADICVRSEIDSYDAIVNRVVTLVFV